MLAFCQLAFCRACCPPAVCRATCSVCVTHSNTPARFPLQTTIPSCRKCVVNTSLRKLSTRPPPTCPPARCVACTAYNTPTNIEGCAAGSDCVRACGEARGGRPRHRTRVLPPVDVLAGWPRRTGKESAALRAALHHPLPSPPSSCVRTRRVSEDRVASPGRGRVAHHVARARRRRAEQSAEPLETEAVGATE